MKVLIFIILLISCMSCSKQHSQNSDKKVVDIDTSSILALRIDTVSMLQLRNKIYGDSDYKVLRLFDLDNEGYDIGSTSRIELTENNNIVVSLLFPRPDAEPANFGVDTIMETKNGFKIIFSWGGGNYFYRREFYFVFKRSFNSGYQQNDILIDTVNDKKLIEMDTTLYFSDPIDLYEVKIKHKKVEITICKWRNLADEEDGTPNPDRRCYTIKGLQKNGFIYVKDKEDPSQFKLYGKILLGKCLFIWNEYDPHWYIINAGDY